MAAEEKLLVVVGIHEGRGFPPRVGYDLVVEVRFAGETLQSDPVDHSSGDHIEVNTELAWEMTRKALQEHKLQRTPIKLVCLCVSKITQKKDEFGYVLLDLRTAQHQDQPQTNHWYSLLHSQYTGKRPELKLSLTTETDAPLQSNDPKENESSSLLPVTPPTSLPPMILDETNGWYLFGAANSDQVLFTISLTLSQPHNLHILSSKVKGPYHFKYSLLGNEILTEEFTVLADPTDFQAERASVRVKATPYLIKKLIDSQPDIQIDLLGNANKALCSGHVPIKPLVSSPSFSVSCALKSKKTTSVDNDVGGATTPTIIVTLAIQQEQIAKTANVEGSPDLKVVSGPPTVTSSPSITPPIVARSTDQEVTAKRNLAQSFEDASNSSTSSTPSGLTTPTKLIHKSPTSTSATPTTIIPLQQPAKLCSPSITTPTVYSPSRLTFTSPKTSPLITSLSAGSGSKQDPNKKLGTKTQDKPEVEIMQFRRRQKETHVSHTTTTGSSTILSLTMQPITATTTSTSQESTKLTYSSTSSSLPATKLSTSEGTKPQTRSLPQRTTTTCTTTGITRPTISVPTAGLLGTGSLQLPAPPPPQQSTFVQQQLEYQAAMELEMWKMTQEQTFKRELKEKEDKHLKMLAEEFQKRDKHREDLVKQKMEHYQTLEEQLAKTLRELEQQRHKLRTREHDLTVTQKRLDEERKILQADIEREKSLLKIDLDGNLQIEKLKSKELSLQLERARRQIADLESRVSQRELEFEAYKEQLHIKPESRLQAELGLLQLEKNELEHKLETALKSKLHYKEQWSKAIKEVAALKHREQSVLRDQLKKQQIELEAMREKYLHAEEQQHLQRQLADIKQETERLRVHTLATSQPSQLPSSQPPRLSHHHTRLPTPSPPRVRNLDANIARWIEERNILLQTGVYTHADSTIQKLDKLIQEALLEKKTHDLSS